MIYLQITVSLVTAIVAVLGIVVSYLSITMVRQENKAKREDARSERFSRVIEHLRDDSLTIRMAALLELKRMGLESNEYQANIVRFLNMYICKGIENKDLLLQPKTVNDLPRPKEDVFLACEIASLFWNRTSSTVSLDRLQAEKVDLERFDLDGFRLENANLLDSNLNSATLKGASLEAASLEGACFDGATLEGAWLRRANLQGASLNGVKLKDVNFEEANLTKADLTWSNLQGADFKGAIIQGAIFEWAEVQDAKNLTAEQLLEAYVDDTTLLDPDLRAEYDRLKGGE